jgi:hypothetical protein
MKDGLSLILTISQKSLRFPVDPNEGTGPIRFRSPGQASSKSTLATMRRPRCDQSLYESSLDLCERLLDLGPGLARLAPQLFWDCLACQYSTALRKTYEKDQAAKCSRLNV